MVAENTSVATALYEVGHRCGIASRIWAKYDAQIFQPSDKVEQMHC